MANIFDLAASASSISAINGVSVAEGMDADKVNDAIRELAASCFNTFDPNLEGFLAGTNGLAIANGGTGATTAAGARTALGAAASGVNTDITALDQDVIVTATGTIAANSIGYRGLPSNQQTAAYQLVLSDAGKHINITTGGIVIPANSSVAFPTGTAIVIFVNSASAQTLTITSDTLRLAGTSSTGARTMAAYGIVSLLKIASTTWVVSGNVS